MGQRVHSEKTAFSSLHDSFFVCLCVCACIVFKCPIMYIQNVFPCNFAIYYSVRDNIYDNASIVLELKTGKCRHLFVCASDLP